MIKHPSWISLLLIGVLIPATTPLLNNMRCAYGDRGSLTATCVNATSNFFRATSYRFDNLDETVRCVNCNLEIIESNTFDLSGNLIKTLNLTNSKIVTLKESSFVGLVFMENLILRDNHIRAVVPLTFRGIKKVITLDMENNNITVILAECFKELMHLETLNLRNNVIKTVDTQGFNGLAKLKDLNLAYNQIRDVKDIFTILAVVEAINLEHNQIMELHFMDLKNLSALTDLNLAKNALRSLPDNVFWNLFNLRKLDLSWNPIDALQLNSFHGLEKLEELDLESGMIQNIPKGVFVGLRNMRILDLGSNRINEFQTGTFSGLPELKSLNVSYNKIKRLERTGVFSLHSLHTLDMSHNNLTDLDYELLGDHMPRLSFLAVQGNPLPCYVIRETQTYFNHDNLQLTIDNYDNASCKTLHPMFAINITSITSESVVAKETAPDNSHYSHNVAMYTLFVFLLLLICSLFYMQFRTMKAINGGMGQRNVSEVQLICSSDLEARENDYFKE